MRSSFAFGLLLVGCGSPSQSSILGTFTVEHLTSSGTIKTPQDLSALTFRVFVDTGTGFTAYPASGDVAGGADGTFDIPDVPDEPFILRITSGPAMDPFIQWEQHDSRPVTHDGYVVGDPDAVLAMHPTPLVIHATGLAAWGTDDQLVADCFDNGTEQYGLTLAPPLDAGATAISASFDWNDELAFSWNSPGHPSLMTAGDTFVLSRLATTPGASGTSIGVLTQLMTATGIAQTDGAASTATGAFTDVAPSSRITLSADLDDLAATAGPLGSWSVMLVVSPGSSHLVPDGPALVSFGGNGAATGTVTSGPISYGNPFDPSWPILLQASYFSHRLVSVPGSGGPFPFVNGVYGAALVATDTYTFRSPTRLPTATLDGVPIDERFVAWDGTSSHVLAVDVPDGMHGFTATVFRLSDHSEFTISSRDSQVTLPASAFEAGKYYALQVIVSDDNGNGSMATLGKVLLGSASSSKCGDGVVDPDRGETCDDGNTIDGDGCSSTCR
jgi:cysteine-rich repeat protein